MPSYRFSLPFGPDPDVVDLADDDHAWAEAVKLCGKMLRDVDGKLGRDDQWVITVLREPGEMIATLRVTASRRSQ